MKTNEKQQQPFFARFLEGQMVTGEGKKEQAGETDNFTSKISDLDDVVVTLKFPSDNDEWL